MVQSTVLVKNETGLHARPAGQLVELCKKFQSSITLKNGDITCDGKRIFSVLHGCIVKGTTIEVIADGPDEAEALEQIVSFINGLEE